MFGVVDGETETLVGSDDHAILFCRSPECKSFLLLTLNADVKERLIGKKGDPVLPEPILQIMNAREKQTTPTATQKIEAEMERRRNKAVLCFFWRTSILPFSQ